MYFLCENLFQGTNVFRFSCVCLVIDYECCHYIVKVV